jgi:diacylglycerol O-acyltransferase
MMLSETDASPMHVGALLIVTAPEREKAGFYGAIRRQFADRLAHTPLLARLVQAPDGYDSDVWADVAACDLDYHIQRAPADAQGDGSALRRFIAARSMERLDLAHPPFRVVTFDQLAGDRAALYFKMHHGVADGIGFQTILGLVSDSTPAAPPRLGGAELPSPEEWRALAAQRFDREAAGASEQSARRKAALAALEAFTFDPANRRAQTPTLKLSAPTSTQRAYAILSLPLARVKGLAAAFAGTINDIFLALAASALRRYLIEIDDLPETPLVVNSARSYRRPEHGQFGNRIVALHPHLATTIEDPIERLRAIQASMAIERRRSPFDEALLDAPEKPYGPRDRRAKFAARTADGKAILPGNITLSNVPGPSEAPRYAGYAQIGNYPVPILGSGRFLNITSRRTGGNLDMGVMVDPTKIADAEAIARYVEDAAGEYERLASPAGSRSKAGF